MDDACFIALALLELAPLDPLAAEDAFARNFDLGSMERYRTRGPLIAALNEQGKLEPG